MPSQLSIIVPTYKRSDSLPRLLDALTRQTHELIEVIVVDQNQDDSEPNWMSDYRDAISLRRVRLQEPNASTARNVGFREASGEVILFVDDDLIPEPDFCARGLAVLKQHGDTVKCLCPIIVVDGNDTGEGHIVPGTQIEGTSLIRLKNSITAAVFFTREYFEQTGGFDELLFRYARTAEDQELFLRMTTKGMTFWLDQSLRIDHDETAGGGCELRTNPYWSTRERCIKSWVLRHRIHGGNSGRLRLGDLLILSRSVFLNRGVLASSPATIVKNIGLLRAAIRESREIIRPHLDAYASIGAIDHLRNAGR